MAAGMEIPPLNIGSPCDCLLAQLHGHCRGVGGFVVDVLDVFCCRCYLNHNNMCCLNQDVFCLRSTFWMVETDIPQQVFAATFMLKFLFQRLKKNLCLLAFHPIVLQKNRGVQSMYLKIIHF